MACGEDHVGLGLGLGARRRRREMWHVGRARARS